MFIIIMSYSTVAPVAVHLLSIAVTSFGLQYFGGREKLALLQLPVLVKYRIALVGVPVASDSRILSAMCPLATWLWVYLFTSN
jgi:hypothetical protein